MSKLSDDYFQEDEVSIPEEEDPDKWWDAFENEEDLFKEEELKDRYAFALDVDKITGMPKVVAMGRGLIAKKIVEQARDADIRMEKDPDMAQRLFTPADDKVVPTQIYGVIAEILTFVYQVNEMMANSEDLPDEESDGEEPEDIFPEEFEGDDGDTENLETEEFQDEIEYEEVE